MAKLLVLTAAPNSVAATRFRVTAFFDALRRADIEPDYQPFVDTATYRAILGRSLGPGQAAGLLGGIAQRLWSLTGRYRYNAVLVHREAALLGPPVIERVLAAWGLPLIYDLDDAVWLESHAIPGSFRDRHPMLGNLIRWPKKGNALIQIASEITCGSERLAKHARTLNPSVTVIPTVPDLRIWKPKPGRTAGAFMHDPPIIGWIGTPSTAPSLKMIEAPLRRLREEGHKFRVVTRGVHNGFAFENLEAEHLPWREAEEPADFADIDIGVAPMNPDEWSNGKCAFKQIQYMACGVPYVSSQAGATDEMLVHGENALIAYSESEWYAHLRLLLTDTAMRKRIVENGHATIARRYNLAVQEQPFVDVIQRAMGLGTANASRAHRPMARKHVA